MEQADARPRAVVLLVQDRREVLLGPVYGPDRCDLAFVEGLLRVQLAARRFGWSIRLAEVRPDLRELVELVGLTTDLVGWPAAGQAVEKGGYSSVSSKE